MVKKKWLIICLFLIFLNITILYSNDILYDFNFIIDNLDNKKKLHVNRKFDNLINEQSEIKLIGKSVIRLYQIFISSQDQSSCIFTISCSRFGMLGLEKYNIFHGIFIISDRLIRCHGMGKEYYPLDRQSEYAIDYSVEKYHIFK